MNPSEVDVFVVQRRKDFFFKKEDEHQSTFLGGGWEIRGGKGEAVYS